MAETASARVLIVDDDTDAVDALVILLEQDGHACSAAYNGAGAMRACQADAFDCLVLDHQLGEVSGLEVAQSLAEHPLRPTRIVMLTGHAREEFDAALRAGLIDGHLQKPADYAELLQLVRGTVQLR